MSIADKLSQIAANEQRVYDAGYRKGSASGGGGGDVFTMTTSASNASAVHSLFSNLIEEGEYFVVFAFMGDFNPAPNNQCISFEVQNILDGSGGANGTAVWTRKRSGELMSARSCSSEYDLIIQAGDVFKKVVLK